MRRAGAHNAYAVDLATDVHKGHIHQTHSFTAFRRGCYDCYCHVYKDRDEASFLEVAIYR